MSEKKFYRESGNKNGKLSALKDIDSFFYQVLFRIVREMKYRNFPGIFSQLPFLLKYLGIHTGKPTTAPPPAQQKKDR